MSEENTQDTAKTGDGMPTTTEVNRWLMECLDVVAMTARNLHAEIPKERANSVLLEAVRVALLRVTHFQRLGFAWFDEETLDCTLGYCYPETAQDDLNRELEYQIENGFFGWALNQPRPVLTHTSVSGVRVIMSALATRERMLGMFVGITDETFVPDTVLKLISVLLINFVNALENRQLYEVLDKRNRDLEETVKERTRELTSANRDLAWAVREAERLAQEASAANSAKSRFLAMMSHEIRTPMNGIVGLSELLQQTDLTDYQRDYVQSIVRNGEALVTIINDILDFSRIEAGKLPIEKVAFNLEDAVRDVLLLLSVTAHEKGLELVCQYEPEVPSALLGDVGRIRQILINLAGNAIKFTSEGYVRIGVSCEAAEPGNIVLRLSVEDTGIGIEKSQLDRVFESFTQADGSISRRFGGTGLGLAISRRLAEIMGGTIAVDSTLGQGSVFTVTLPMALDPECAPPERAGHPWAGCRVLVLDTNAVRAGLLAGVLARYELRPYAVDSPDEAAGELLRREHDGEAYWACVIPEDLLSAWSESVAGTLRNVCERSGLLLAVVSHNQCDRKDLEEKGITACLRRPLTPSAVLNALGALWECGHPAQTEACVCERGPETDGAVLAAGRRRDRPRVLVAEDNAINQRVAQDVLTQLGADVELVANGRQAVEILAQKRYALVFMDMQMPEMDGVTATRLIRERERMSGDGSHVPIIAMTANVMKSDRDLCFEAGMDDHVAKPFRRATITATLHKYLGNVASAIVSEKSLRLLVAEEEPNVRDDAVLALRQAMPNAQIRATRSLLDTYVALGSFAPEAILLNPAVLGAELFRFVEYVQTTQRYANTRLVAWGPPESQGIDELGRLGVHVISGWPDVALMAQTFATALLTRSVPSTSAVPQAPAFAATDTENDRAVTLDLSMALANLDGDRDLLDTLLRMALELIPAELKKLRIAWERQDGQAAVLHAHTLKGQAMHFGAESLRAHAFAVESAAKEGNWGVVQSTLPDLDRAVSGFCSAVCRLENQDGS